MPADGPLHKAANSGDVMEIQDLLRMKEPIDGKGAQGRTALMRALGVGAVECVSTLLEGKADVTILDQCKRSSAHPRRPPTRPHTSAHSPSTSCSIC